MFFPQIPLPLALFCMGSHVYQFIFDMKDTVCEYYVFADAPFSGRLYLLSLFYFQNVNEWCVLYGVLESHKDPLKESQVQV